MKLSTTERVGSETSNMKITDFWSLRLDWNALKIQVTRPVLDPEYGFHICFQLNFHYFIPDILSQLNRLSRLLRYKPKIFMNILVETPKPQVMVKPNPNDLKP